MTETLILFFIGSPLCNHFGCMFGIIAHLKDPLAPELYLPGWCRQMFLTNFHITLFPYDALFPKEVHQFFLQYNSPTTWYYHPCTSHLAWFIQAFKHPPFSSKWKYGPNGQTVPLYFVRPQEMSPKLKAFVPVSTCKWPPSCRVTFQPMSVQDMFHHG